jgi:succinate dehydrogenase/fumarate reductase flavoprotein subunit
VAATGLVAACTPSSSGDGETGGSSTTGGGSTSSGGWSWETPPEPITDIANTVDADLVIVGAGMAGINVASAAAANGMKVVVVERTDSYVVRGADNAAINSKYHTANGIVFDKAQILKELSQWPRMQNDLNLVKLWVYRSGEVFDDLIDLAAEHGLKPIAGMGNVGGLENEELFYRQYPTSISFVPDDMNEPAMMLEDGRWVNNLLGDVLLNQAQENGAEFAFNFLAEQLVKDGARVSGVIAKAEDGTYTQFNATKGVVLCTGDISGNPEMLEAWAPIALRADPTEYVPPGVNDGSGMKMALWAGAAVQRGPAAPMIHAVGDGTLLGVSWLSVNRLGKRFVNELYHEVSTSNSRLAQPGGVAWYILDSDYAEKITKVVGADSPALGRYLPADEAKLQEMMDAGKLWKADTLEDLAAQIGIEDVETFLATVSHYNDLCAAGQDTDFLKPAKQMDSAILKAPFYARWVPAVPLVVIYGLNCTDQLQVCDAEDNPIEGLYAAGNMCGNYFVDDYPMLCPGQSHGRTITTGRLLGTSLATGEKITVDMSA